MKRIIRKWPHNKNIQVRMELKDGVKHGICELYYPNGNYQCISFYKNGKRNGIERNFRTDGFNVDTFTRKEELLNGVIILFKEK